MMHKHVKEGKKVLTITIFCTEEKNIEKILNFFEGCSRIFAFRKGGERRGMAVHVLFRVADWFLLISTSCNYSVVPVGYSLHHCTNQLQTKPISGAA
jgi:hypothetical protein